MAIVALLALAMWPPSSGAMLLVPVKGGDTNAMVIAARATGAALLGQGPFRGSMVVIGDRRRIADAVRFGHVIILAAPPAGCGDGIFRGAAA